MPPKKVWKKKETTRNWLQLPRDVTASILKRLGAVEIPETAQKVCMLWRNLCKNPSMHMCIHAIDRSFGQLPDVYIENFGSNELLTYIAQRYIFFPILIGDISLRRLCLVRCYYITDKKFCELVAKLLLLEELDMTTPSLSEEPLKALERYCPLLKSLKWNQFSDGQPRIGIEGDEMLDDFGALAIAKNMPKLCHLQLIGNRVTNDGLQAILDGCPHLESLDLRKCFNVTLSGNLGKRCAEKIKNLQHPNDSTHDYGLMAEIFYYGPFDEDGYFFFLRGDEDDLGNFYFD
ncbi:hypothetical protein ACJW30_05G095800 [Castanea mollissima]